MRSRSSDRIGTYLVYLTTASYTPWVGSGNYTTLATTGHGSRHGPGVVQRHAFGAPAVGVAERRVATEAAHGMHASSIALHIARVHVRNIPHASGRGAGSLT